jgi:hypothetical protein
MVCMAAGNEVDYTGNRLGNQGSWRFNNTTDLLVLYKGPPDNNNSLRRMTLRPS